MDTMSDMSPKEQGVTKDQSSQWSEKISAKMRKRCKISRITSSRLMDKLRKRMPKKRQEDPKRVYREADVEKALYRWYARMTQNTTRECPTSGEIIRKAAALAKKFGADSVKIKQFNREWTKSWYTKFGIKQIKPQPESIPEPPPVLDAALEGYSDDQIYTGLAFEFDWTSLPDRSMERRAPEDRVWLLMAGNKSGRHRTRMLITGKEWRPESLKHVNMLSQPVVYAGGGVGRLTPDLFSWWFHREFSPAALVLNEAGAILVMEKADYLPPSSDCVSSDGKVKLVVYSEETSPNIKLDQSLLRSELKTRYAMLLLHIISMEQSRWMSIPHYLSNFSLKEAFPLLHRAWLNVRPETFRRAWSGALGSVLGEEDRMLLLELQWISHDIGFEVTDEDVQIWSSSTRELESIPEEVKTEPREETAGETVPTASEAVNHLSKALVWMESEPIEPSYLLVLRDIITIAKQASKMGLGAGHPGSGLPFFCHNGDPLSQPPPAHMGIPPYQLDPKGGEYWRAPQQWKRLGPLLAATGLTRPPMYPFSTGQYPYPMLSPEISQVAASWHTPSMYPISSGSAGFRSPYPSSLPITSSNLASDFYRFSPTGLMGPHPGLSPHSHPAIVTPGPKQELQTNDHNHRPSSMDHKSSSSANEGAKSQDSGHTSNNQEKKKPHIKKPLNAFMLYMKEMRAKVVAECTLKESAAINQILGRRWHALGREEQAKYYELARRERQLHMQLYPDWSSRANTTRGKKRKRKQEPNDGGNSMKKCRARYGLDQQSQWCKPCRRKKKCIRYKECGDDGTQSEDNLGSCGSIGESGTPPDDDGESYNQSSSSPGGLSALSSLTSPSMILPSPSASLASPSVSLASPCMSLQSPLTPHTLDYDTKPSLPSLPLHNLVQPHRNPVGTNPHDINNPLSVNQLTGKCIKNSSSSSPPSSTSGKETSRTVISVP
ncbi:uncharacterized protein LOC106664004 isoform X2 [Cimex lectularius]|uniref:dTCF n=1 Tax=Cimex lectularius TaxID=79782 RepID=A0A8I6TCV5_CIMLE|nr:uncharacterized protein LOC106664004 isoform X2 [Cimex lectularius]